MITKGLSTTTIAEKLKTTRQFVNQTKLAAEAKLSTTLLDIAQANDFQVTKLYPQQGMLLGYHPVLKRKAILTYSTNYGIKVWYWHNNAEEVTNEEFSAANTPLPAGYCPRKRHRNQRRRKAASSKAGSLNFF